MNIVVKPGDTLAKLARTYGVTVAAIASANGIRDVNKIRAGQALTIPGATIAGSASALQNTAGPVVVGVLPVAAPIPGTPTFLQNVLQSVPAIAQAVEESKTAKALARENARRAAEGEAPAASLSDAAASASGQDAGSLLKWVLLGGGALFVLYALTAQSPKPSTRSK